MKPLAVHSERLPVQWCSLATGESPVGSHRPPPVLRIPRTQVAFETPPEDMLALDESLTRLEQEHPREHEVVMLRYFGGLEMRDIATTLELSLATIERSWSFSRAWLHRELTRGAGTGGRDDG